MTFKKVFQALSVGVVICLGAQMAHAKVEYLQCNIADGREGTWIPSFVIFAIDDQTKETIVMDSVIKTFMKKPISAKVKIRGNKMQMFWHVAGVVDAHKRRAAAMNYAAFYNTKTHRVAITAKVGGMPQAFSGKGTCKRTDSPKVSFEGRKRNKRQRPAPQPHQTIADCYKTPLLC